MIIFSLLLCGCICETNAQKKYEFEHISLPNEFIDKPVNCIIEDSNGFIWLGFGNGLVFYDGYKGKAIHYVDENKNISNFEHISSLVEDNSGKIYIGTHNGVYVYNPVNQVSLMISDTFLTNNPCRSLNKTSKGELLVGTENGLFIYAADGTFLEQYSHEQGVKSSLSNNIIRSIYEDKDENIWIGTFNKLNLLDRKHKTLTHYKLQKQDSLYHNNNLILSIKPLDDKNDDILLVGTETGLCLFNTKTQQFTRYRASEDTNSISNSVVKVVCKVDDKIWLGTDLGLNTFDNEHKTFQNHYHNHSNTYSISNNVIQDILFDSHRNLWIATSSGLDKVYINSNNIFLNQFNAHSPLFKEDVVINEFSNQKDNNLWIATNQGAFWYDALKDTIHNFSPPNILHNIVNDILLDRNGIAWIATAGGLNTYNPKTKTFSSYIAKAEGGNALTTNYINCIAQDSKGNIWLGTENHGLFKVIKKTDNTLEFINYKYEANNLNSISSSSINDLALDADDNVWVASERGLDCFFVEKGIFERFYDQSLYGKAPGQRVNRIFVDQDKSIWISSFFGGYKWNSTSRKFGFLDKLPRQISSMVAMDSTLYYVSENRFYYCDKDFENSIRIPNSEFGLSRVDYVKQLDKQKLVLYGKEGFALFDIDDLKVEERLSKVKWTSFSINNDAVYPYTTYNSRHIINQHIDNIEALDLDYNENSFKLEFSSFPFNSSKSIEYKFLLENYDNEWQQVESGQNYLTYTQVRPGDYNLKVKASDKYGQFNSEARTLSVHIAPPIYFSSWALSFYVVLLIILILYYRQHLIKKEREKNELHFEKLNHKRSDELIQLKTRFFTNITHELKTPLTLISSPVDDLIKKPLDPSTLKSLLLVKKNTDRLRRLVSQILDIRKIEAGGERLRVQKYDIVKFCNQILNQFREEALKRKIFLQFSSNEPTFLIWVDVEKVEKILFNLLSNAFKFTPDNGTIRLSIDTELQVMNSQDYVTISVTDTGSGINEEDKASIFNRFGNLSSPNYTNQKGTGIGMSIIHEYVALHAGKVDVESLTNVGSKFIVALPKDKSHFKNYDIINEFSEHEDLELEDENEEVLLEEIVSSSSSESKALKLLIIEDDADIREYLKNELHTNYEVLEAEDGLIGKNIAINELPEIIISDLMMPNLNGLDLCKALKSDIRTSHIPFILLTAKNELQSKIKSIEFGADDYIQKPFDMEHLVARIKNLIHQRQMLRETIKRQIKLEPSEVTVNSLDESFLDDVLNIIDEELDNSDLNVKFLSDKLGLSTTNLYRKIKALTGQTATEFIRNIRLNKAAQLLRYEHLNVSDVMYKVGFTHHSYFTKCFKELHGISPKSYK